VIWLTFQTDRDFLLVLNFYCVLFSGSEQEYGVVCWDGTCRISDFLLGQGCSGLYERRWMSEYFCVGNLGDICLFEFDYSSNAPLSLREFQSDSGGHFNVD